MESPLEPLELLLLRLQLVLEVLRDKPTALVRDLLLDDGVDLVENPVLDCSDRSEGE